MAKKGRRKPDGSTYRSGSRGTSKVVGSTPHSSSIDSLSRTTRIKNILGKIVDEFGGSMNDSVSAPNGSNNLKAWVEEDLTLRTAVEMKHSTMVANGYYFTFDSDVSEEERERRIMRLRELRFDRWRSRSLYQDIIYRNNFTELCFEPQANQITSLSVLPTEEMEIVARDNGTVLRYLQIHVGTGTSQDQPPFIITFPIERIVHSSIGHIDTSLWGKSELLTAIRVTHQKRLLEDYISWMFKTNQFRPVVNIPELVNDDDIEKFILSLIQGMRNPTNFLLLQGDSATVSLLREFKDLKELLVILDDYRSQILTLLQVPPLQSGSVEGSNRSSVEFQIRYSFYTDMQAKLRLKDEETTYELFPRLFGDSKMQIHSNRLDDKSVQDVLDSAVKLAGMGGDKELIERWLREQKNIDIPEGTLRNAPEGTNLDRNDTSNPSRQPQQAEVEGGIESADVVKSSLGKRKNKVKVSW